MGKFVGLKSEGYLMLTCLGAAAGLPAAAADACLPPSPPRSKMHLLQQEPVTPPPPFRRCLLPRRDWRVGQAGSPLCEHQMENQSLSQANPPPSMQFAAEP